jgi:hypothetical protein
MNFSYKLNGFLISSLKKLSLVTLNLLVFIIILSSCSNKPNKEENIGTQEKFEPSAYERAKNFAEKNPVTLFGKDSKDKNTNFDFSTSNVLWRASLKTLDFIPLVTVDYSGGIIITDWYSEGKSMQEQIKIQVRFFSTELRSDSVQVTSYKKICEINNVCSNISGNENFNKEIKDLIINTARQIKIEENKKK